MFSTQASLFSPLPAEISCLIFKKMPDKELVKHRLVCKVWCLWIDNLLFYFDQELLADKFKKVPFYAPIFEEVNIETKQNANRTWRWLDSSNNYFYFYRSPEMLFNDRENRGASGCYKVWFSHADITKKQAHLKMESRQNIERFIMAIPLPPEKIAGFISKNKLDDKYVEHSNPFEKNTSALLK